MWNIIKQALMRNAGIKIVVFTMIIILLSVRGGLSFDEVITGTVLRKSIGRNLVFSLTSFEIGERNSVTLRNRVTGEEFDVKLLSAHDNESYSVVLDDELLDRIEPRIYECYVVWHIPDDIGKMEEVLHRIHEYQNTLRKNLGKEMVSPGQYVSSRVVIGKIQKFHRICANIVEKFFEAGRMMDKYDLFRYPIHFEIGFSPDVAKAFGGREGTYESAARELLYEEFGRTLWFEFGFGEDLIEIIFGAPLTVKNFFLERDDERYSLFVPAPYIEVPPEVLNAAWYVHRQDLAREVRKKITFKLLRDSVIYDREVLRRALVNGWVVGTVGKSLILSFSSPYVYAGDSVYVRFADGEAVPVKIREAEKGATYSVTEGVNPDILSKITSPVPVSLFPD